MPGIPHFRQREMSGFLQLPAQGKQGLTQQEKDQQEYQSKIDLLSQEVSRLNDSLAESKREIDFYKNIEDASGELNVPSSTEHDDDAQLDPEQAAIYHEMEHTHNNYFITGKAEERLSFDIQRDIAAALGYFSDIKMNFKSSEGK